MSQHIKLSAYELVTSTMRLTNIVGGSTDNRANHCSRRTYRDSKGYARSRQKHIYMTSSSVAVGTTPIIHVLSSSARSKWRDLVEKQKG